MLRATASQQQLSLVISVCICNHIHNVTNVAYHNVIHFSCKLFKN